MSRVLTAQVLAEITKGTVRLAIIAELETFNPSNSQTELIRAWTGVGDLVFNGNIFKGIGDFGGITPITEVADEIQATPVTFTLSGIPLSLISLALGNEYRGRPAKAWLAFFDPNGALIPDPLEFFTGRLDRMKIKESVETAIILMSAESRLADLKRPRVRRRTAEDQKQRFPGDEGLDLVATLQNTQVVWGG